MIPMPLRVKTPIPETMIRSLAPQLDDVKVGNIVMYPSGVSFWGPGTLVRGTAHKYRITTLPDGDYIIHRVATYPTCDPTWPGESEMVVAAASYRSELTYAKTIDCPAGVVRVALVGGGKSIVKLMAGVALNELYNANTPDAWCPLIEREHSVLAVTFNESEIEELVGPNSPDGMKTILYYCAACGEVAGPAKCPRCGHVRADHAVFTGGHEAMVPSIASAIGKSGHKFTADPRVPYAESLRDWIDTFVQTNTPKTEKPRRLVTV